MSEFAAVCLYFLWAEYITLLFLPCFCPKNNNWQDECICSLLTFKKNYEYLQLSEADTTWQVLPNWTNTLYATTVFYWNTPDSGKLKGRKELCIRIAKPSIIGGHQGLKKIWKGFFRAASSGLSNLEQPQMTSKFYIISKIR